MFLNVHGLFKKKTTNNHNYDNAHISKRKYFKGNKKTLTSKPFEFTDEIHMDAL